MLHIACPNDGMKIPLVDVVLEDGEPIRFYWCWSCALLFAFLGDRLTVEFHKDVEWRVFRSDCSDHERQVTCAAVQHVKKDRPSRDA